ncbi:MAG TPA: nucleotidyltransferase family protein [Longimicrobium sp.]
MSDQSIKDDEELEVPPRYDFSGAVRGRVARRFTPEERDELISPAVIEDTHLCAAQNKLLVEGGMNIGELIHANRDMIRCIAEQHGARNVRLFGSVARGDAGPESDVDFLVEAGPATSSWFPGGLVADLETLLGRRVDLVTERGLAPDLREQVLREAVPV